MFKISCIERKKGNYLTAIMKCHPFPFLPSLLFSPLPPSPSHFHCLFPFSPIYFNHFIFTSLFLLFSFTSLFCFFFSVTHLHFILPTHFASFGMYAPRSYLSIYLSSHLSPSLHLYTSHSLLLSPTLFILLAPPYRLYIYLPLNLPSLSSSFLLVRKEQAIRAGWLQLAAACNGVRFASLT